MVLSPARIAVQLSNLCPNNDGGAEDEDNDGGDDEDVDHDDLSDGHGCDDIGESHCISEFSKF